MLEGWAFLISMKHKCVLEDNADYLPLCVVITANSCLPVLYIFVIVFVVSNLFFFFYVMK